MRCWRSGLGSCCKRLCWALRLATALAFAAAFVTTFLFTMLEQLRMLLLDG